MRAGTLRELITIQRQQELSTAEWGTSAAINESMWRDIATDIHASVEPTDAGEAMAGNVIEETYFTIKLRYGIDIISSDRIVWRGLNLDIIGIENVGNRNREIEVRAVNYGTR